MRLDLHLAASEGIKSRTEARKLVDAGCVRVNGERAKKASMEIEASDRVEWTPLPKEEAAAPKATTVELPVLFEDEHCMVVNKPAGLIVHPGNGTKKDDATLLDAARLLFAKRGLPFSESEVLVHRLDKDTTGCLLLAKTGKAHLALQKQFSARTVDKRYLALVYGKPSPAAATIDAPIGRHATKRTTMSVHQSVASREARTTYRTLDSAHSATLLECELHTGRTHQIRVHMRTIGHPVLGDGTYGMPESKDLSSEFGIHSICLHAWKLSFVSLDKKEVSVICPAPECFVQILQKLGLQMNEIS